MDQQNFLRNLPSVHKLLQEVQQQAQNIPPAVILKFCRLVLVELRQLILKDEPVSIELTVLVQQVLAKIEQAEKLQLKAVINATGIVIHTNLGRAPLGDRARQAVASAMDYCNVEYDLSTGQRGSRTKPIEEKICELTGAEAALAVNNNAAAVLLVLTGLAQNRDVLISRGQLVEIGGAFRIPDVIASCGASLVEVGTTNKTYLRDYEQAISETTGAILKVHTSNYRLVGFTSQPEDNELTKLARQYCLPAIYDAGSGTLLDMELPFAEKYHEPTVGQVIKAGYDIVTFSGDKLLGACQAGIIIGKRRFIEPLKKHPLMRALRLDKLSLAALEGTLLDYLQGRGQTVPVQDLLRRPLENIKAQAQELAQALEFLHKWGWQVEVRPVQSFTGGGAFPALPLTSFGVVLQAPRGAQWLEALLRQSNPPVIGRIEDGRFILDLRTVRAKDIPTIISHFQSFAVG